MVAQYAKSYIDQLYEEKDIFTLHGVIDAVSRHRNLPEQFSLFSRLMGWWSSSRSGMWQYYEYGSPEEFESMAEALGRFGFRELAERYRSGVSTCKELELCRDLDRWIDDHWSFIEAAAFRLIADHRGCLYAES